MTTPIAPTGTSAIPATSTAGARPATAGATEADAKTFSSRREEATRAATEEAVRKTQSFVQRFNSDLKFSIDDTTGVTVIKVIDQQTQELIRQIPSEEMLEIARAMERVSGLLLRGEG